MMRFIAKIGILLSLMMLSISPLAKASAPVELTADSIEYNSNSDIAKAQGQVKVISDGSTLTGNEAEYNFNTKTVIVNGSVTVHKGDLSLYSSKLEAVNNNLYTASGNVKLLKGPNTLTGNIVIYDQNSHTVTMPDGGNADGPKAQISGNYLKGNILTNSYEASGNVYLFNKINDIQSRSNAATYKSSGSSFVFNATGNVQMNSTSRDMTASANEANYTSADNGKLVLQGNATARQHNSIVRGNLLTIYLGDNVHIQ